MNYVVILPKAIMTWRRYYIVNDGHAMYSMPIVNDTVTASKHRSVKIKKQTNNIYFKIISLCVLKGWSGEAKVLIVGQGPIALAVEAGGCCV